MKLKSEGNFIFVPYGSGFWKIENVRYNGDIQYIIVDGKVGSSMLDLEIKDNESIIMAQWATGDYVEKWSQEVGKYLTNITNSTSGNSQQVPDTF